MTDYSTYNDSDLLHLVAQKDENAFTEIYYRYWQKLYAIAYNRLKDAQLAEDTVQEVFTGLWTNNRLTDITSPENYLAVATKYVVLGKLKNIIRERESFSRRLLPITDATNTVEADMHSRQLMDLLKTEVEKLPEKCRLIFKYSRNEGMPVKQIASRLHISPKTVENQLTKAMRQLRLATRQFFTW